MTYYFIVVAVCNVFCVATNIKDKHKTLTEDNELQRQQRIDIRQQSYHKRLQRTNIKEICTVNKI